MSRPFMTKIQRAQLRVMREEITPWGLSSVLIVGGPHAVLQVIDRAGNHYRLVIASPPRSDGFSLIAARNKARQLMKRIRSMEGLL